MLIPFVLKQVETEQGASKGRELYPAERSREQERTVSRRAVWRKARKGDHDRERNFHDVEEMEEVVGEVETVEKKGKDVEKALEMVHDVHRLLQVVSAGTDSTELRQTLQLHFRERQTRVREVEMDVRMTRERRKTEEMDMRREEMAFRREKERRKQVEEVRKVVALVLAFVTVVVGASGVGASGFLDGIITQMATWWGEDGEGGDDEVAKSLEDLWKE
jgi:putative ribosome biogenesis GTPase RsgA